MDPLKFKYTAPRLDLHPFTLSFMYHPTVCCPNGHCHCLCGGPSFSFLDGSSVQAKGQLRDPYPEPLGASRWTPHL